MCSQQRETKTHTLLLLFSPFFQYPFLVSPICNTFFGRSDVEGPNHFATKGVIVLNIVGDINVQDSGYIFKRPVAFVHYC